MKQFKQLKVISIMALLTLIFVAFLTACSPGTSSTVTQTATATTTTVIKPIPLVFSSYLAEDHALVAPAVAWTKQLEADSNGRLSFKYFFNGTLVAADTAWTELKSGTVDICEVQANNVASEFPLQIFSQSVFFGCPSMNAVFNVYDKLNSQIPELAKEWSGAKTLAYRATADKNLHSTKAVRTLADFKGLKIRIAGKDLTQTLTGLGASLLSIPSGEVYTGLQKGIIEANVNPNEFMNSFKTAEITKYTTYLHFYNGIAARYLMNQDKFNSLPADLQKLINDSLPDLQQKYIDSLAKDDKNAVDYANGLGHEWIELSDADKATFNSMVFAESTTLAKAADAKSLPGTKMIELAQELLKKEK